MPSSKSQECQIQLNLLKKETKYPAKVLIAEDNKINQMLLKKILEKLGCDIDLVDDGLAACEAAGKTRYDVIFMDINMPKMNGLEATRHIRHRQGLSQVSIIAVTANALEENRNACREAGMDGFVSKPYLMKEFEEILKRVSKVNV